MTKSTNSSRGFAIVETILVLIIIGLVVGTGYWVITQRKQPTASQSTTTTTTAVTAKPGTAEAVDQDSSQDGQSEAAIDKSNDKSDATAVQSTNSAAKNLGGAYNETAY